MHPLGHSWMYILSPKAWLVETCRYGIYLDRIENCRVLGLLFFQLCGFVVVVFKYYVDFRIIKAVFICGHVSPSRCMKKLMFAWAWKEMWCILTGKLFLPCG